MLRYKDQLGRASPLASALPSFRSRDGQLRLAQDAGDVMDRGGVLVAEAATGIGKSLAYLVPAALSGRRVVVSTATKALQGQLLDEDLPLARLLRAHGVKIDTEKAGMAQRLGLRVQEGATGIQVKAVLRDGAAEQAGMAAGDEWLGVEVGKGTRAQSWRLKKLDDLSALLGTQTRCRALVSRDQSIRWLVLKVPTLASNWKLLPDPSNPAPLKRWL